MSLIEELQLENEELICRVEQLELENSEADDVIASLEVAIERLTATLISRNQKIVELERYIDELQ